MRILSYLFLIFLALPGVTFAHAVPVSSNPESSQVIQEMPASISIRFSEKVDAIASAVVVTKDGFVVSGASGSDPNDPRTLTATLTPGEGLYSVSWSVVSKDDGHFTKGAYSFVVGSVDTPAPTSEAMSEVVQIATVPEALAMTVELMGNGFLWAALLLFAIAVRPILDTLGERRLIERGYTFFIAFGAMLVFAGGILQVLVKSADLAGLRETSLLEAIPVYLQTAAGSATLFRSVAVLLLVVLFTFGRSRILASRRITAYEIALFACMAVFAYFRASISHATANPFHPPLSIAVNFLHVIEKDVWAGITGILLVILLVPRLRLLAQKCIPRAFVLLSANVALVGVTACYIVWLHLKSFHNLFTTQWGAMFVQLLVAALFLIVARTYHVVAYRKLTNFFARWLPATIAIEFALAMLVVYFSSIVIITSPPLSGTPQTFSASDRGVTIALEADRSDDASVLMTLSGGTPLEPDLTIQTEAGSASVAVQKVFEGGYAFPKALLTEDSKLSVSVPQSGAYDAHASFEVNASDFEHHEGNRSMDSFTMLMILLGITALLFAGILYYSMPTNALSYQGKASLFVAIAAFFVVAFIVGGGATAFATSKFANPYKFECESDGNMWHLMVPSIAGETRSSTPQEGCMWGMGNYTYQFPDYREYRYLKSLPQAEVSLETQQKKIVAGVPTQITVSLKEKDGSPAKLFVDMEKLIHVVIVGKDQTTFAHIHADDTRELTAEEINTSTFGLTYTFPKAGTYLLSVDYAHGITLESKQFTVEVGGAPRQNQSPTVYESHGTFGGYKVSLTHGALIVGEPIVLQYEFEKEGVPATDLQPYLSAPMHISVVKNDLSTFMHVHGEVHPSGTTYPPIVVRDGKIIHSMQGMMYEPPYGPKIEAHVLFPSEGVYTIWGQFKVGNVVIPTSFTVRVEK